MMADLNEPLLGADDLTTDGRPNDGTLKGRNLVVFIDGTTNTDLEIDRDRWTNIVRIRDLMETAGDTQKWWYCTGVGSTGPTFGVLPKSGLIGTPLNVFCTSDDPKQHTQLPKDFSQQIPFVRVVEGAQALVLGKGTLVRVKAAYSWLCSEYRPGDHIYVWGFSRGAFAARCLNGLIRYCGLVRPDATLAPPANAPVASQGGAQHWSRPFAGAAAGASSAISSELVDLAVDVYNAACRDGVRSDDTGSFVVHGSNDAKTLHDGMPHEYLAALLVDKSPLAIAVTRSIKDLNESLPPSAKKITGPLVPATFRELYARKLAVGDAGGGFADPDGRKGANFVMSLQQPALSTVPLVRMLGVFDTVPHTRRQDLDWFHLLLTDNVVHAYHALSLDETRENFQLLLWNSRRHEDREGFEEQQVWFPGNHGDVGGGWEPYKAPEAGVWQRALSAVGLGSLSSVPPGARHPSSPDIDVERGGKRHDENTSPWKVNKGQGLQELCCQWMLDKAAAAGLKFQGPWRLTDDSLVRLARHGIVHDAWDAVKGGAFSARDIDIEHTTLSPSVVWRMMHRPARYTPSNNESPRDITDILLARAPPRIGFAAPINLSQSAHEEQVRRDIHAVAGLLVDTAGAGSGAKTPADDGGAASPTSAAGDTSGSGAGAMPVRPPSSVEQRLAAVGRMLDASTCAVHPDERERCYEVRSAAPGEAPKEADCKLLCEVGHHDVWAWMVHTAPREAVSSSDTVAGR